MTDDLLITLMSRDFVLVDAAQTVEAAREAVPLGHVAVVMQGGKLPVGILTEDRLLELEEAQQPLTHYAHRFLTPTLTPPTTPLADVLLGMSYSASVRWHVVAAADTVLGVIAPGVLFALLSQWQQQPPAGLSQSLQTLFAQWGSMSLGMLLRLPGDPIQPKPKLSGLCCGTHPPHRPEWYELDYTDRQAPTCTVHPGTRIVWAYS